MSRTIHPEPVQEVLGRLAASRFRGRIRLSRKDFAYASARGRGELRRHATQLITQRLAPATPPNDGRQTPWKGHPVFTAQHATATCCRSCLAKWHGIPKGDHISTEHLQHIVALIDAWLAQQNVPENPPAQRQGRLFEDL